MRQLFIGYIRTKDVCRNCSWGGYLYDLSGGGCLWDLSVGGCLWDFMVG